MSECPRCAEWERLGLSNTCPTCDMETIKTTDLIEALETATEESRELDLAIHEALGFVDQDECGWIAPDGSRTNCEWPKYTADLNDIVAEVERREIISWHVCNSPGGPTAWLYDGHQEYQGICHPGKGTPALALCAALLRAIADQENG